MSRRLLLIAAILGALGVALGAFGAHGLSARLQANGREGTFETASRYHMYGALAVLATAVLAEIGRFPQRLLTWAGGLLTAGTLVFSGSLYILAIFNVGFMGAIAPIGGTLLIAGWGVLAWAAIKKQ